ncbi:Peptidase C45 acyl-coenzyme A:6-aminopenicillanic acid acyl-transferase [Penicillium hispanicum]|uniref:Peptidase C45 acyl-coenzyme A:6-aminopenicillanic acid acyl-transferase n=1 Tax=Penicillium hispanicum TaxID=1080232 RepID=UPI002541AF5D|nr:Peptidase C45 acyl-coenzyme A:6-aminopenicillanic acid acyl-transferase [Penicillium hispanicum]KAJ5578810.1 Peptidase C45 acyl-coenzyme A:6-aminopenicillanic acid acyl-transferase [Penicillium hispanicum]
MPEHPFFQHIVVHGLPYDRGFSYGEQTKEKIRRNVTFYKQSGKLGPWLSVLRVISECYIPGLQLYWPSGWEEMRGVAAGAGVTIEEIVMLNARYDLSHVKFDADESIDAAEECTSTIVLASATRERVVFTAQNWDMSHRLVTEDAIIYLEIHPDPSENIPSMFLVTEAGQLGRSGFNGAGLGLTANSLQSDIDLLPDLSTPIPPSGALRRLFLEQSSYSGGLKSISRTPRHVSCNIMVSSAEDIGICLEVTPQKIFRAVISSASDKAYIVHSNHFQTGAYQSQTQVTDTYLGGSSWYRGERLEAGLREQALKENLTENDVLAAFKDHAGYPHSLCEHFVGKKNATEDSGPYCGPTSTVCCVLYNLSKRTLQVCKGCPCEGVFQEFALL